VTETAPGRIYINVNDIAKDDPTLARQFFDEEVRPGYKPKAGIGDRAVYRADYHALIVLDDNVVYKVQVLSDKLQDPAVLGAARKIYERLNS
jgi:hypothetical protein